MNAALIINGETTLYIIKPISASRIDVPIIILKHLRQFVQSDWFLPVFILHDKDTTSGDPD